MSHIYTSVDQLVGGTPLMELVRIEEKLQLAAKVYAKLEYLNPTGSAKDRAALGIINDAEKKGILKPGGVIIESTSGNTGIGLASIAASRGYKAVIVMPDTMSAERIKLMQAYGAEVVLSDGSKGMSGSLETLAELKKKYPDAIEAGQFVNPANAEAHYETTGPEIFADLDGKVDIFVAGIGTGGTITGTGRYLKENIPGVQIAGVEPADSPILSGGKAGKHGIQGIGADFVPAVLDTGIYDMILTATTEDSYEAARLLGRTEGIMTGISSGAALWAAIELAKKPENAGRNIVALLPDSGDRYLSTDLWA